MRNHWENAKIIITLIQMYKWKWEGDNKRERERANMWEILCLFGQDIKRKERSWECTDTQTHGHTHIQDFLKGFLKFNIIIHSESHRKILSLT